MSFVQSPSFIMAVRPLVQTMYGVTGLCRIAQKIQRYYGRHSRETLLINDFDETLSLYCDLHEHISSHIFWRQYHSGDQLKYLEKVLSPYSVFIDIGANMGEFTLWVAKRVPKGRVISFEPFRINYARLEKNVSVNHFSNVQLQRKGLGERKAILPMYSPEHESDDGLMNLGAPTLFSTPTVNIKQDEIEVTTADEMLAGEPRIDVIKIDAEGSELPILRGAVATLARHKPIILLELNEYLCSFGGYQCQDIVSFLQSTGYAIHPIVSADGKLGPALNSETMDPGYLNFVALPARR